MKENKITQTDHHSLPATTIRIQTPYSNNIPNNLITAQDLLVDRFSIEISQDKTKNKRIELTLGDKICFVKPPSDLVCDIIVRGHLSKRHYGGLESPTVYVLVANNKFDIYRNFI